ncbi:glycosyltransferase family protein [Siphonobacter sp.]|uniref:glycosyltransferase family protein n=1 Tax=Siphonobacter sp. TaxID=1869184 RepID=UPI003B3B433A
MRILFFIQGEGRGHQTQAIALYEILRNQGHELVGAIVGVAPEREISPLLRQYLPTELKAVESPALLYSDKTKALAVGPTLLTNARKGSRFWRQAAEINAFIQEKKPTVIVNFYEMMCGVWQWQYRSPIPVVCIAHQYLLQHRHFELPAEGVLNRRIVNTITWLSALGSCRKLALSFYEMADDVAANIYVIPPLLRQNVLEMETTEEPFLLAYTTNYRLASDLEDWCRTHPDTQVQAFWDRPGAAAIEQPLPNLTLHQVNATAFLDAMRRCRGLVSTSGFESICEAMYLGKPVMLFPTPGHFEQAVNALDAVRAGVGIRATSFLDLDRFLTYLPTHQSIQTRFQDWHRRGSELIVRHLEELSR